MKTKSIIIFCLFNLATNYYQLVKGNNVTRNSSEPTITSSPATINASSVENHLKMSGNLSETELRNILKESSNKSSETKETFPYQIFENNKIKDENEERDVQTEPISNLQKFRPLPEIERKEPFNDQIQGNLLNSGIDNMEGTSRRTLHSNLDDLLNVDRQRRALRYKRDSNYENLMALMSYLDANGIDVRDQKNLYPDLNEYYENVEDPYSSSLSENQEIYETEPRPNEDSSENVYLPLDVKDLLNVYTANSAVSTSDGYGRQVLRPHLLDSHYYSGAKSRRSNYYSRLPYGVLPGQRRKRNREDGSFGRWGNFIRKSRNSYEHNEDANRLYSLASLLADQNTVKYPRNKRSYSRKQNQLLLNPM